MTLVQKIAEAIAACEGSPFVLDSHRSASAKAMDWCFENQVKVLYGDYLPVFLQEIPSPPKLIFFKGDPAALERPAMAVVGARKASDYGLASAFRFSKELASHGFCVISGLARGVDGMAHRGALVVGGRTVAVLGGGFARLYPSEHRRLAQEILNQGGAWITEYPPFVPPLPFHFPRRNRIISGLSVGTLVVEARRKSGSLITAYCGLEQGREVFVVPGRVDCENFDGGHDLIRQGAKLVSRVEDILEEFPLIASVNERNPATPIEHMPFEFGESFSLSEWNEKVGPAGAEPLRTSLENGGVTELSPQRYLSVVRSE